MKTVTGSFSAYEGDDPGEWIVIAVDSTAGECPTLAVFQGKDAEDDAHILANALNELLKGD